MQGELGSRALITHGHLGAEASLIVHLRFDAPFPEPPDLGAQAVDARPLVGARRIVKLRERSFPIASGKADEAGLGMGRTIDERDGSVGS